MPVKLKPHIAAYHQTNCVPFVILLKKTVSHLFLACVKLSDIGDFILHLLFNITGYIISIMTSNFFLIFDFSS